MRKMHKKRPPLARNDDITLHIDAIGSNGQGIGRVDGYAVFVPGALPGEDVDVHIIKAGSSFGVGKLTALKTASAQRVTPRCGYFQRCGGCTLEHMDYAAQLISKREQVRDALERIGGFKGVAVADTIGMDEPWHYRNKGIFPAGGEGREAQLGFYTAHSHMLVPLDDCLIVDETIAVAMRAVQRWINEGSIGAYDETTGKGTLRSAFIRKTSGGLMVMLVTTGALPYADKLVARLRAECPELVSIVHNVNKAETNVVLGDKFKLVWGQPKLTETICGIKFELSPQSFMQTNPIQTEKLYKLALDAAHLTGGELVVDAYCGVGTISLLLAQHAGRVIGIELDAQAIEDAKGNASLNGITNTEFIAAPAEAELTRLVKEGLAPDVVTLDPPRGGCESAVLSAIAESGAKRVVYISCAPATLARDLKLLAESGYKIISVQPVDMFPHTTHVETVVLMSRVEK
jgi:23S rRNA (uracil1939-C5)-methyltransferase